MEEPLTARSRVTFTVREGPRFVLSSLTLTGGRGMEEERLRALAEGATGPPGEGDLLRARRGRGG